MKVILIDWNLTLSDSLFWGPLKYQDPQLFKTIETCLFNKNADLICPWMRGAYSTPDILRRLSGDLGLDYDFLENELIKSCQNMTFLQPEILTQIAELRARGYQCVIATDNMDVFARYTVPALSLDRHFDAVLSSSELGCLKIDRDEDGKLHFFQPWLDQQGIEITQAILIDDSIKHKNFFESQGLKFWGIQKGRNVQHYLERLLNKEA